MNARKHILVFLFSWAVLAQAEFGSVDRPGSITGNGNVTYRAAAPAPGTPNGVIAVGRAWNGSHYLGVIAGFVVAGGWHDPSFGSSSSFYPARRFYDFTGAGLDNLCNAVVYAYDGFIVACRSQTSDGYFDTFLLKVDLNGNPITSFGTNGIVDTNLGGNSTLGHAFVRGIAYNGDVNIANHGVVAVVGMVGSPGAYNPYLATFDQTTGAAFGSAVTVSSLVGTAVGVAYDSGSSAYYLAATESSGTHAFHVYRYAHNATTPTTLNAGWSSAPDFSAAGGGSDSLSSSIIVSGSKVLVAGSNRATSATPPWRCAVAALDRSTGALVSGFGQVSIAGGTSSLGVSIFSPEGSSPTHDCILNSIRATGTNVFVAGSAYSGANSNYDSYVALLNASGSLVSSFGSSGQSVAAVGPGDDVFNDTVISGSYAYAFGRVHDASLYQGGYMQRFSVTDATVPPTVTSISVTPASTSLYTGQQTTATATATYSDLSTSAIPSGSLIWSVNNSSILSQATAAGTSTLSALSAGSTTVSATPGGTAPSGTSSSITVATPQTIFVTTGSWNGNFGNLYTADLQCQIEAVSAGLSGTWKAVLSDDLTTATSRLSFTTGIVNTRGSASGGAQLVAANGTAFWGGTHGAAIAYAADGSAKTGSVWTGSTSSGGTKTLATCASWTGSTSLTAAEIGSSAASDGTALDSTSSTCNNSNRLYCVNGQASGAAPPNPLSVSKSSATTSSVSLTWVQGIGTTAGFRLAYQTGATAPANCSSGTVVSAYSIGARNFSYTVTGLTSATQYSFRLCAVNSDQTSITAGVTVTASTN